MRTDPDVTRAVRSWLDEGVDRLPERVLDSVLDAVPSTPQRRSTWSVWRSPQMPQIAKLAAAIAAVVIVALVGFRLLPGSGGLGGQPSITPAPTTRPTPPPSPSPDPALTAGDIGAMIDAGAHRVGEPFSIPLTMTLPDDFTLETLTAGDASVSSPAGWLGVFVPQAVFEDPCHITRDPIPQGTADDFVTALTGMTGFDAGSVEDTTIGGHSARSFTLSNTIDTSSAKCTRDAMLPLFTYIAHPEGAATNGGTTQKFWVVEVGATPVIVAVDGWSSPADLQSLETIVRSLQLG